LRFEPPGNSLFSPVVPELLGVTYAHMVGAALDAMQGTKEVTETEAKAKILTPRGLRLKVHAGSITIAQLILGAPHHFWDDQ
jgi:hypothetical protein